MTPDRVLGEMSKVGLNATEFGPIGFLPEDPKEKSEFLAKHNMQAIGGFYPILLHDSSYDPLPAVAKELEGYLASKAEVLVLAASTGVEGYDGARPVLSAGQWDTVFENLDRVSVLALQSGVLAVLHPHVGTMVESAEDIEKVLAGSTISFCLDTGHMLIGGTDPVEFSRLHGSRIAHSHLKDVNLEVSSRVRSGELSYYEGVQQGLYTPLGQGDVDVRSVIKNMLEANYRGWFALEQDNVVNTEPADGQGPLLDARVSVDFINQVVSEFSREIKLSKWFYPKGELVSGPWEVVVDDSRPGWKYTGTKVGNFKSQSFFELPADKWERAIWPLDGEAIMVDFQGAESGSLTLRGRESVFHGPADFIFLPRFTSAVVTGSGRFIVAEALATADKNVQLTKKEDVSVLIRGVGGASRQIHDYGGVDLLDASAMVVVEVIVPPGNHSGIPPHKHDRYIPGVESNLEEIYYFELATDRNLPKPERSDPVAFFRAYASDERPIDLTLVVRDGDVALLPYGYHGPTTAVPPYDLYFMNVMAGPDPNRSWNITDDPDHAFFRTSWPSLELDARLPYEA